MVTFLTFVSSFPLAWWVLAAALGVALAADFRWGRIPDAVTYPLALVGLGLRGWDAGLGDVGSGALSGLLGWGVGALAFAWPAWRGGLSWGDVKLLAGVGAVVGFPEVLSAAVCVALVGAVQAAVTVLWTGEAGRTAAGLWRKGSGAGRAIPYGVAIALGTAWSLWWQYPAVIKR